MNKFGYRFRLMMAYRDALRTRLPFLYKRMIDNAHDRAVAAAHRLKDKDRIEVAFLLTIPGMWKLDYVFKLMQQSGRYHPYVVIYPYSQFKGFDKKELSNTVRRTEDFIKQRGFEYVIPYDEKTGTWDDIRKSLNPDIVFFTTPYRDILPSYYYYNFKDKLTCYVPYSFLTLNLYKLNYNQISVNLFGLNFAETDMHLDFAKRYSPTHGRNFVATGYPGIEVYSRNDYVSPDVWRQQETTKKRVIWAPHHTIDDSDNFQISTFLIFCETMQHLAKEYAGSIQFAFKPHQLLKFKLEKLWGVERTEDYYRFWAETPNCQLEESGYVDLFIHSDAMIHDSGSFTSEYLCLGKPVMFLIQGSDAEKQFNDFGVMAFRQHYHGKTVDDIRHFLDNVVLRGDDPMRASRDAFKHQYLGPRDGLLPSQCIMNAIEDMING